jgi:cytochrome bd-type quinol oxidase subunit 2
MNLLLPPILANGLIMLEVAFVWLPVAIMATLLALTAIVLAAIRRTRKASQKFAVVALVIAFAPLAVMLWYADAIASYGHNFRGGIPAWIAESILPVVLAGVAVWLSRRQKG